MVPGSLLNALGDLQGSFFVVFGTVGCVLLIYSVFLNFDCYFAVFALCYRLLSFAEPCGALLGFLLGFLGHS